MNLTTLTQIAKSIPADYAIPIGFFAVFAIVGACVAGYVGICIIVESWQYRRAKTPARKAYDGGHLRVRRAPT